VKYVRVLILLLMAISLVFRVQGVWSFFTAALLVTLNAPMMMIVAAAMAIGLLEAFTWLYADYVLFHLLVYVASAVALLLSLAYRSVEKPDQARSEEEKLWLALIKGKSNAEKNRLIEAMKVVLAKMEEDDAESEKS